MGYEAGLALEYIWGIGFLLHVTEKEMVKHENSPENGKLHFEPLMEFEGNKILRLLLESY